MNTWCACVTSRRLAALVTLNAALVVGMAGGCGAGSGEPAHTSPVPLPAATGTSQQISRDNLAYLWPLTVDHGTIECRAGDQAVFIAPDGKTYALNDAAKASATDIAPIRATGADRSDVSLGALRSRALALCTMKH